MQVAVRLKRLFLSNLDQDTAEEDILGCLNEHEKVGVPAHLEKEFKALTFWPPGTIADSYQFKDDEVAKETVDVGSGSQIVAQPSPGEHFSRKRHQNQSIKSFGRCNQTIVVIAQQQ
ncbi:hypothetical protein HHI36_004954 [Cryptolaemus montrouzieri]|uniref:Uncharacterized protein n=1 Tax=Cryptolaemus montrouzieri TaxID=559131 RepID=A0ABD2NUA7_9CUCU